MPYAILEALSAAAMLTNKSIHYGLSFGNNTIETFPSVPSMISNTNTVIL
jgi:hypothetical protein